VWWWLQRDDPPPLEGVVLPKWVQWLVGLLVVVPLAMFVVINFLIAEQEPDDEDRAEIAVLEDTLRPRGAVEDTLSRYESAMQQIADKLSLRQPGLTWHWDPQTGSSRCTGEFEDTSGAQLRRRLVANGPIADDMWAPAHQIVRDNASQIGVSYVSGFALPNGDGGAIDLTQTDVAVLSGMTPCQLRRAELERG
jgi:Lipoprotein confined to pathogenic Mycobacterium